MSRLCLTLLVLGGAQAAHLRLSHFLPKQRQSEPCLLQGRQAPVGAGNPIPSGGSYGPWTSKNFSTEAIKNTPCAQDGMPSVFDGPE